MNVIKATEHTIDALVDLEMKLWPDHTKEDLLAECRKQLHSDQNVHYLIRNKNDYIAFIHVSIRNDYVEGANSSPVGYVEGIFVEKEFRMLGLAKKLIAAGEEWAKAKGCRQMGSDTELANQSSLNFHIQTGFSEANRIISFIKDIK
ncbi:aminoglycoside 6'-N-acetyltransferase [Sporolactobacillus laevolacticus]|uniref:Aminoglycoside N(6')-acetyltransferase type 1 n=1 Tax=Sporolactobacillus laevolacticus DSM 442 TaxID=1395513 RepID=V6IYQ5_9BACL|nr:aminoglycoside 6'-N-acetyltransferase [Sporolactobacillus laevolacticus]EST12582.1 GCN5 family acetyltransferase [Sporolactobacillus laevolacticus DSM 442]